MVNIEQAPKLLKEQIVTNINKDKWGHNIRKKFQMNESAIKNSQSLF